MRNLLPLLIFLISLTSFSQNPPEVSNNLFSINVLTPSLELETRLSQFSTLDLNLGTGFSLAGGAMYDGVKFGIYPNLKAQYRNYYNLEKRLSKNKNVANNSGNYIAFHSAIRGGNPLIGDLEKAGKYSVEGGPVWGLQRVYGSGFKLNLNLGIGYGFNDLGNSGFTPLMGFQLGWLLFN